MATKKGLLRSQGGGGGDQLTPQETQHMRTAARQSRMSRLSFFTRPGGGKTSLAEMTLPKRKTTTREMLVGSGDQIKRSLSSFHPPPPQNTSPTPQHAIWRNDACRSHASSLRVDDSRRSRQLAEPIRERLDSDFFMPPNQSGASG